MKTFWHPELCENSVHPLHKKTDTTSCDNTAQTELTSFVETNQAISVLEASCPLTRHLISLLVHLL
jgi:hypothetical protein